jgi:hypothetical protein
MNPVEMGPVAQRITARGYEQWCQGFESLLAHPERGQKGGPFGGREVMIGIADAKLWTLVFTKVLCQKLYLVRLRVTSIFVSDLL